MFDWSDQPRVDRHIDSSNFQYLKSIFYPSFSASPQVNLNTTSSNDQVWSSAKVMSMKLLLINSSNLVEKSWRSSLIRALLRLPTSMFIFLNQWKQSCMVRQWFVNVTNNAFLIQVIYACVLWFSAYHPFVRLLYSKPAMLDFRWVQEDKLIKRVEIFEHLYAFYVF